MAHMSLMTLFQDRFQDIQEFCNQYVAIRRMCDELELRFGRCTEDVKAMLKEQGNDNPTTAQLKKALDKIEDGHHAILFYTRLTRRATENMSNSSKIVC